ncbi:TIM barrel protein [Rhizobium sp. RU36D]|uniref:TIM barrel protein n=1 Tax=Rhizobium sp. RU36D TaxID=1907415 RepID=UPI0009D8DFEA|nr:TIM barrel protein [Rhizobium sp. RU36D]SMC46143.1 2-keto-myo-inositol isomerase [Rhizobium sp. RU36D]
MQPLKFAINHMTAPKLPLAQFLDLAKNLGLDAVEIRNDLTGNAILDGTSPKQVRALATERGIEIISINALQRFNDWTDERKREAEDLIAYASECGAKALVLVPKNDGTGLGEMERRDNLDMALNALAPLLQNAGLIGLVEPLGFEICSLRLKSEAAAAIGKIGGDTFRLVHDTFHHHLAGETAAFPELTGLVHISGVTDGSVAVSEMRDPHRVLIDASDRLGNVAQIKALRAAGYNNHLSFEPFAAEVHALSDPLAAVRQSMDFIRAAV